MSATITNLVRIHNSAAAISRCLRRERSFCHITVIAAAPKAGKKNSKKGRGIPKQKEGERGGISLFCMTVTKNLILPERFWILWTSSAAFLAWSWVYVALLLDEIISVPVMLFSFWALDVPCGYQEEETGNRKGTRGLHGLHFCLQIIKVTLGSCSFSQYIFLVSPGFLKLGLGTSETLLSTFLFLRLSRPSNLLGNLTNPELKPSKNPRIPSTSKKELHTDPPWW